MIDTKYVRAQCEYLGDFSLPFLAPTLVIPYVYIGESILT